MSSCSSSPRSRSSTIGGTKARVDVGVCTVTNQEGSKLMSQIRMSTVLIKMVSRKFVKARVHYVLITPYSGRSPGYRGKTVLEKIPALLMSRPNGPGNTTREAEILPLAIHAGGEGGTVRPLLLDARFKSLFETGTKYRLKVVAFGRPWCTLKKGPRLRGEEGQAMLKKLLKQDILQTPWKRIKKKSDEFDIEDERQSSNKLSVRIPSGRIHGLSAASGHRDFAAWFRQIPPDVKIDKQFQCDTGVLKKDNFKSTEALFQYLRVSPML